MALNISALTIQCINYPTATWAVSPPQGPSKAYTVASTWLPTDLDLFQATLTGLLQLIYPLVAPSLTGNRRALAQAIILYKMTNYGGNEKLFSVASGQYSGTHIIQVYPTQLSRTVVLDQLPVVFTEADYRLLSVVIPYVINTFSPTLTAGEH